MEKEEVLLGEIASKFHNGKAWWEGGDLLGPLKGAATKFPQDPKEEYQALATDALLQLTRSLIQGNVDSLSLSLDLVEELTHRKIPLRPQIIVRLAEILYELVVGETFPLPSLRNNCAVALACLLKKFKKDFSPGFHLQWRPLFLLLDRIMFPPRRLPASIAEYEMSYSLIRLCKLSRRWFPEGVFEEIRDACMRRIRYLDGDEMARAICLLSTFLPPTMQMVTLLEPGSFLWTSGLRRIECLLFHMLSKLAKTMEGQISWSEFSPFYLDLIHRHLKLPKTEENDQQGDRYFYSYQNSLSVFHSIHKNPLKAFGKWMAYASYGDFKLLNQIGIFLCGLDSYFHPSNTGPWTCELSQLLYHFASKAAQIYDKRGRQVEHDQWAQTLAETIWPAVHKLTFSKDPYAVLTATSTSKSLALLHPQLVLDSVIEGAGNTLQSLTEPHRTVSCIGLLGNIVRVALEFKVEPKSRLNLFNLLPYCVDGIDHNDPFKTIATLHLFTALLSTTTLSPWSGGEEGEISSFFIEELTFMLLDRSFTYISNLSPSHADNSLSSSADRRMLLAFSMPQALHQSAVDRLRIYALESQDPSAFPYILSLLQGCKGRFAGCVLERLVPQFVDLAILEIEACRGTDIKQSDHACKALIWQLACILGLARRAGDKLVNHFGTFERLLRLFPRLRQLTVTRLAAKIFKALIRSLTDHYICDYTFWSTVESSESSPFLGSVPISETPVLWHIPMDGEREAGRELLDLLSGELLTRIPVSLMEMDVDGLRALLTLTKSMMKGASLIFAKDPSNLAQFVLQRQWFDTLMRLARKTDLPPEVQLEVLYIFDVLLNYTIADPDVIKAKREFRGVWSHSNRLYPKQTQLSPLLQAFKLELNYRIFQDKLIRLLRGPALRTYPGLEDVLTAISLGPYDELSKYEGDLDVASANVLAQGMQSFACHSLPAEYSKMLFEKIIPAASVAPPTQDYIPKGALHLLRRQQSLDFCTKSWSRTLAVLQFGINLMLRKDLTVVPNLSELLRALTPAIYVRVFPFTSQRTLSSDILLQLIGAKGHFVVDWGSPAADLKVALARWIKVYQESSKVWRVQLTAVLVVSLLAISLPVQDSNRAITFLLECLDSEVTEVRSLAVNRLIPLLYRYARHLRGCPSDGADWDWADLEWQRGVKGDGELEGERVECDHELNSAIERTILQSMKWITHDSGNNETKLSFRTDVAELFQSMTDLYGERIVEVVERSLDGLQGKGEGEVTTLAYHRALCESLAGIARSLSHTIPCWRKAEIRLWQRIVMSMCSAGFEAGRLWNEIFKRPERFKFLLQDTLTRFDFIQGGGKSEEGIVSPNTSGGGSASTELCNLIQFTAGVMRGFQGDLNPEEALVEQALHLISSPYDLVRRSNSILLMVLLKALFVVEGRGGGVLQGQLAMRIFERDKMNEITHIVHLKSILLFVERCTLDPIITGLWTWIAPILPIIWKIQQCNISELQRESRRVSKVLAGTGYCPVMEVERIIEASLKVAEADDSLLPLTRELSLEFLKLFMARNTNSTNQISSQTSTSIIKLLSDPHVKVRIEASECLKTIFHSRPQLARHHQVLALSMLRSARPYIKDLSELVLRHAAVLLSSSLILSSPYTIADWMPSLVVALVPFINDRHPIQGTIRTLFSEFKRTHQDNWEEDSRQFTDTQREAINELLVGPSYYV